MTTSGSYFVLKLGWSEGWVDDQDKIVLLDGPQEFTNNDYWELSKVFKNHTQAIVWDNAEDVCFNTRWWRGWG